jgi:NADH-quinone oxidoreductase subunit N
MTATDLIALLPFIILAAAVVVVMLTVSFYRRHGLIFLLTLGGLIAASIALPIAARVVPRPLTPLLIIDYYALFFMGLIFGAAFTVSVLAYDYFKQRGGQREELYLLLLLAVLGAMVLVASRHFAAFFLGLELLSVSLFALIAYPRQGKRCLEAGFKYLVLSSVASSFLLFGMALIYAELGTLAFASIGALLAAADELNMLYLVSGLALLMVGIGFKLSWVPFHLWTLDIYEGAPAPSGDRLCSRRLQGIGIRPAPALLFYGRCLQLRFSALDAQPDRRRLYADRQPAGAAGE